MGRAIMTMQWIGLVETGDDIAEPRHSSLGRCSRKPAELIVTGNLPHGYTFRPLTYLDRDRLIDWLESLQYPGVES